MAVQFDAVKEATDAFTKLFKGRGWLLGAPTFAGAFLIGVVFLILMFAILGPAFFSSLSGGSQTPDIPTSTIVWFAIAFGLALMLGLAVSVFTYAWTLVAADQVWVGGEPAFDRGFNRAAAKLPQLLAFYILIFLLSIVSIITIVGPFVIAFFAMYGPAAIVFDDKSATQAIAASFRMASENIGESLILVLAFIVLVVASVVVQLMTFWLPFVGIVINLATNWLLYAYIPLAVVRFYDILKASGPPIPIVPRTS